jgi:hypothetical protein
MLARTVTAADAFFGLQPVGNVPMQGLHDLMKHFQCTKWFVNRKLIEIVDRTLTASGGAGCMQLFSPDEAFEHIGRVTLGIDPRLAG